jgi:hypothetical protein
VAGSARRGRGLLSRLLIAPLGSRGEPRPLRTRRSRYGTVACLEIETDIPAASWSAVAAKLAAAVAEIAEGHATLARVGIVPGEPPVLAAYRPRRDIVAILFRDALTAGATHRRPHLWLGMPPGVYLASAVDPDTPFAASPEALAGIIASGGALQALLAETTARRVGVRLKLAFYATPGGVRSSLRAARRILSPARD